jgi:hypothetical protein
MSVLSSLLLQSGSQVSHPSRKNKDAARVGHPRLYTIHENALILKTPSIATLLMENWALSAFPGSSLLRRKSRPRFGKSSNEFSILSVMDWFSLARGPIPRILEIRQAAGGVCLLAPRWPP